MAAGGGNLREDASHVNVELANLLSFQPGMETRPAMVAQAMVTQPPSTVVTPPAMDTPSDVVIPPAVLSQHLPFSAIDKSKYLSSAAVIVKHLKLTAVSKAPTLAVKLARFAVFGDELLGMCTVMGYHDSIGLPTEELTQLKQIVFNQYPTYWGNPVEFEQVWASCIEGIGQAIPRIAPTTLVFL